MKRYKVAILNTKGGVGKSTASMQLMVPYLYQKSGSAISYFEFDDENEDAVSFDKSQLVWIEKVNVTGIDLREQLRDILLLENSICIDVGANKTTVYVMEALIDSGMVHALDLVVIPLMDGELDAVSAINVYHKIKEANEDIKVVFVLNRWNENREIESQFDLFLGDKYGFFDTKGLVNYIEEKDRNYIVLADSDAIKYSRGFGMTLWEIALSSDSIDQELKEAIKNGASKEEIKKLSFIKGLKKDCKEYHDRVLKPAFERLDEILG